MNSRPTVSHTTRNKINIIYQQLQTLSHSRIVQTWRTVQHFLVIYLAQISSEARAALLVVITTLSTSVSATLIYSDDFERAHSSQAGFGWFEHEADSNDVAIYQDRLRLRDYTSTGLTNAAITLDTSGFETLQLSIDYQVLSSTETSDTLGLMINGINFWNIGLGNSGSYTQHLDLASYASNNPALQLSFWLDVNSHTEAVYLERISLYAEPLRSTANENLQAVPEPSSFSLISLGFATLLMLRNRKPRARTLENPFIAA